jgi:predicted Zn-dependent protease
MKMLASLFVLALAVGVSGCTDMTKEQQGMTSGAAIGAAGGAGIAALSGGKAGIGAIVGGVAGAVAGNIKGASEEKQSR